MTREMRRTLAYWLLAGPGALIVALTALAGMPVWFPKGLASIDHLFIPMILFPAVWGGAFFYVVLSERLWRVVFVFSIILVVNISFAIASGGWT